MNRKPPTDWIAKLEDEFGQLDFLAEAGVPPMDYVNAKLAEGDGFELPAIIERGLWTDAMMNHARRKTYQPAAADPTTGLYLGDSLDTLMPIILPCVSPLRLLIAGGSGSGKTNLALNCLKHLRQRKQKVRILVWEYKPEIRRIIPVWKDAIIFSPRNAPWQFLIPVGPDKLAYYIGIISEIRHEFELRPETTPLLWSIIERMLRGLEPDDPPFSWQDFRRVVEYEAAVQKRENLLTAARAILNICVVLGPQASARVVPDVSDKFSLIAYDFVGQDPAILRLFLGFEFTRLLFKALDEGHTENFRRVYVFDEGSVLFSAELMNRAVAHISAAKRFVSMCRFAGTGFIIGCQNLCQIDPFVTQNCDVLVVFRCPSVQDATVAAQMLGVGPEAVENLMRLPTGVAYVRAAEWEAPVKVNVPLFAP